jgi:hypothetical protein
MHAAFLIRGLLAPAYSAATALHIWHTALSVATNFVYAAMCALLAKQRVASSDINSIVDGLVHTAGRLQTPCTFSEAAYCCRVLWRHKLWVEKRLGTVSCTPAGWFWIGGSVSWLVAVAVDTLNAVGSCGMSPACLLLSASQAASPMHLLGNMISMCMRSSRVFAVDVVLPGLLLTWLELRARRAWWQQQQQARQQQAPSDEAAAAAPAHKSKQQVATIAGSWCASSKAATLPATPSSPAHSKRAAQATQPLTRAASPAGSTGSTMSCSSTHQLADTQAINGNIHSAAASALAGCRTPPAALTAAAAAAAQPAPHPLLYRSPVGRRLVAFKFAAAPGGEGLRVNVLQHGTAAWLTYACVGTWSIARWDAAAGTMQHNHLLLIWPTSLCAGGVHSAGNHTLMGTCMQHAVFTTLLLDA